MDGRELGTTLGPAPNIGNWRVESGMLAQDSGFDGVLALLEDYQLSNQTVETDMKLNGPSGGGGIAFWFQGTGTLAYVALSNGTLSVAEVEAGVWQATVNYPYPFSVNDNKWVNLRIEANSSNGELDVYIDNVFVLTHNLTTSHRIGQTGVIHGNAGGYFDNFNVNSDSIIDSPINKLECKKNGWKTFTNPSFKNQGNCVSYVQRNHPLN